MVRLSFVGRNIVPSANVLIHDHLLVLFILLIIWYAVFTLFPLIVPCDACDGPSFALTSIPNLVVRVHKFFFRNLRTGKMPGYQTNLVSIHSLNPQTISSQSLIHPSTLPESPTQIPLPAEVALRMTIIRPVTRLHAVSVSMSQAEVQLSSGVIKGHLVHRTFSNLKLSKILPLFHQTNSYPVHQQDLPHNGILFHYQ